MPKQSFNKGSGTAGPHRQGEKGGKGGMINKTGESAEGPTKSRKVAPGPYAERDDDKRRRTPTVNKKANPEGKGSGNR